MKEIKSVSKILNKTDGKQPIAVPITYDTIEDGDSCRAFVWDGATMVPYTQRIVFAMDTMDITEAEAGLVTMQISHTEKSAVINNVSTTRKASRIITLSGTADANATVTIKMQDAAGNIVYLGQAECDNSGMFSIDCKVKELSANKAYTLYTSTK